MWFSPEPASQGEAMPQSTTLQPGACARGFVTFEVPDGVPLARVLYSPSDDGSGALTWKTG
jgi:hypothetical protein